MGNLPLDEFYPAVSMVALMRIFRDQSLSQHHTMVVQAITFIFKSLGLKCVQFLPQVMPTFLNVIRVCDGAIREVSVLGTTPSFLFHCPKLRIHILRECNWLWALLCYVLLPSMLQKWGSALLFLSCEHLVEYSVEIFFCFLLKQLLLSIILKKAIFDSALFFYRAGFVQENSLCSLQSFQWSLH